MKPENRTVTQLLGLDVRYVVPRYRAQWLNRLYPRSADLPARPTKGGMRSTIVEAVAS